MNIHSKQMQQISSHMEQWVRSNLSTLGIYECNYSHFNVVNQTLAAIPSDCRWHYHFLEQNLDLHAAKRLNVGVQHWREDQLLFKTYKKFNFMKDFNKIDFVQKTNVGYNLVSFGSTKKLFSRDYARLMLYYHYLCKHAGKLVQQNRTLSIELRDYHNIKQRFDCLPEKQLTEAAPQEHDTVTLY